MTAARKKTKDAVHLLSKLTSELVNYKVELSKSFTTKLEDSISWMKG